MTMEPMKAMKGECSRRVDSTTMEEMGDLWAKLSLEKETRLSNNNREDDRLEEQR